MQSTDSTRPAKRFALSFEPGNAGFLRPGRFAWLRALAWLALLLAIEIMILSLQSLVGAVAPDPDLVLAMAFVCTLLAYGAYALLVRWGEKRSASEIAIRFAVPETICGLAIGAIAMAVIMAILWATGLYTIETGVWTDWPHDLREALGTGLLEELLARLILFRLLTRAFGLSPALLLSSIGFGAAHLGNDGASLYSSFAIAIEAGLMLAAFYVASGRVWLSVGVHAGWNLAQGGLFGARVSGFESSGSLLRGTPVHGVSDLLSGGAFGPEASLPAIVVGFLLFTATMLFYWRYSRCDETPCTVAGRSGGRG
jgi:membrane protease YdiL (CAAX protease family)